MKNRWFGPLKIELKPKAWGTNSPGVILLIKTLEK